MSSYFGSGEKSTSDEYLYEIVGFIRVYKDGRVERLLGNTKIPAGFDPSTLVESKDVVISPETNLSARIYIPRTATQDRKLPILVYFHGGGFLVESTTSPSYNPTLTRLVAESNVIAVSVDYRLGPEFPVPTGYNDSWEAIKWIASHNTKSGHETYQTHELNQFGDFGNVFFAGDSAGANIANEMAIRVGLDPVAGINLKGVILLHPYFGGSEPIGSELGKHKEMKIFTDQFWMLASGLRLRGDLDDPLFNPGKNPNLSGLGCSRVLVALGEKDSFRDRGLYYKELMEKSGWNGKLEMMESEGEDHVFFLLHPLSHHSNELHHRICAFIKHK